MSIPESEQARIGAIRDLVRRRVAETSLRDVAAAIGMSHSGLFSFLQGRDPYSGTRKKLIQWYIGMRDTGGPPPADEVTASLAVLSAYVNQGTEPEGRERRLREVFNQLAAGGGRGVETIELRTPGASSSMAGEPHLTEKSPATRRQAARRRRGRR